MPGNVAAAAPATVLPNGLAAAFSESVQWPILESDAYPDGRTQRRLLGANSRKSWNIGRRLTQTEWGTLLAFYEARKGPLNPFYFYPDPLEYDGTGASTAGRWTVRFTGAISRNIGPGRSSAEFSLIQVS